MRIAVLRRRSWSKARCCLGGCGRQRANPALVLPSPHSLHRYVSKHSEDNNVPSMPWAKVHEWPSRQCPALKRRQSRILNGNGNLERLACRKRSNRWKRSSPATVPCSLCRFLHVWDLKCMPARVCPRSEPRTSRTLFFHTELHGELAWLD